MIIIGLTGGIASGKSFVEKIFLQEKISVFDADLEVHKLISSNKEIFSAIKNSFPKAILGSKIDRKLLGAEVFSDKEKLEKLEGIIYPVLRVEEDKFIKSNRRKRRKFVVLNIPLLFEKGGYERCDKTVAVMASKAVRFSRFKARFKDLKDSEIRHKFNEIIAHQASDIHRKKYADFLIYNSLSKASCTRQVKIIIKTICNLQKSIL